MQCRKCGAEIADKAIVCYRCGTGTTDPVRKAVPIPSKTNPLLSFVVVALLALGALYLGYAGRTAADPNPWNTAAAVLSGVAIVVLLLRIVRRRR